MSYNKLRSFVKDYFTLTSRERKGAIVLAGLISLNICCLFYLNFTGNEYNPVIKELMLTADPFQAAAKNVTLSEKKDKKEKAIDIRLQSFDPNKADSTLLLSVGLSNKQVKTILNYRRKGGFFYKPSDMLKVYGLSNEKFKELEPFILIDNHSREKKIKDHFIDEVKKEKKLVSINTADTNAFQSLPMIGSSRARLICRYRDAIGGFVSKSQLLEVYTIDSAVFSEVQSQLILDVVPIRKVNINSDSLYHPYLNNQLKRAIKAYRIQHGNFNNSDDLRKLKLINDELYNKLVPYVSFE